MRTSIDYARDYLDVEKTSVNGKRPFASLADVIRAAQVEAYAEGKQDGMSKFLEIASTRVTRRLPGVAAAASAAARPAAPEPTTSTSTWAKRWS